MDILKWNDEVMLKIDDVTLSKEMVKKLISEKNYILLDVRTESEYTEQSLENSINIPLAELDERYSELNEEKSYILFCAHGVRSVMGSRLLREKGLKNIYNSQEGIATWE